jgi:peptide/nickel transport system permease protein
VPAPEVTNPRALAPPLEEALPATTGVPPAVEPDEAARTRRRLGFGFWLAVGWLVLIVALALLAPVLPLADPDQVGHGPRGSGATANNWLGTDEGGRDLLSRTIWGARVSLLVGFASIAFGLFFGGAIGMFAGFYRGPFDRVSMASLNVLLAFPAVVLALLLVTFLGRELQWILLVIGILAIAPIGRLARANTMVWAERDFVTAAQALGASRQRILKREILPNIVLPMVALALLGVALAIVAEGSLAFLGLSVEGATSTWGKMIVAGSSGATLRTAPQAAFVPIGAMFLTVLALNLMGDRLRVYVDVRESLL